MKSDKEFKFNGMLVARAPAPRYLRVFCVRAVTERRMQSGVDIAWRIGKNVARKRNAGKLMPRGCMNKGIRFAIAAVGSAVLSGCNGWPDTIEYNEAENKPEKYVTYTTTPADSVPMFVAEHHRYMIMPTPSHLRLGQTRQVGSAGGASVFALQGDQPPYGNLFARTTTGEVRAARVID
jgi:hypothetical protein